MNSDKKTRNIIVIIIIAVLLMAALGGYAAAKLKHREQPIEPTPAEDETQQDETRQGIIEYKGQKYKLNRDIETALFLGVDYGSEEEEGSRIGTGQRADSIFLFIMDKTAKTTRVLSINRDTITDVDAYDEKGNPAYTKPMQITLQYSFGDSPGKSCFLMKRTVSRLLYETPIDGCISITLEGVNTIVDKLGGIDLTMPEDYTYIDPRYTAGAEVKLSGPEVEHFIRYRDTDELGSNEKRMERQSWLIGELFRKLRAVGNSNMIEDLMNAADDHIQSDLSGETIKMISGFTMEGEILNLPGEYVSGDLHDEYHVDDEALKALVVENFYIPAE